jgi:hypothetical protein
MTLFARRQIALFVSLWMVAAAWPFAAQAAEFRSDKKTVHVKADEVIEGDLYAVGEKVTIEGTIKGDLIVFGSQIEVKGTVEGDLAAAGQTVLVESEIGDDARIAGQVVKFAAASKVAGDLLAAGMSLELEEGATVGGDVIVYAYQTDLSGDISGNVQGGMANARLAGAIGGDVNLDIGGDASSPPPETFGPPPLLAMPRVPAGLTVASTAKIDGKLSYTGTMEAEIEEGATTGDEVEFKRQKVAQAAAPTTRDIVLGHLRHFACVAMLGLAMVLLLPRWSTTLADNVRTRPLLSLVGGIAGIVLFVVLLVVLVVGVIALAVFFGWATLGEMSAVVIVLGILSGIGLIGGFWLFTSYLAQAIASLALGRLATGAFGAERTLVAFVLGFVVFALLCVIPYAGPWIALLGVLLALGALMLWIFGGFGSSPAVGASAKPA